MKTILIPTTDPRSFSQAQEILKQNGLVVFPTDTVYGVAANAYSPHGIERLFEAKGRDSTKAIPVLVGAVDQINRVGTNLPEYALRLISRFWPGPLTLVVPRHPSIPMEISPSPTIGVRMPDHHDALGLLLRTGPLATTSANLSGGTNPLTAQDALVQLDGRVDLILDGGTCPGGVPSTVVDCTSPDLNIIRSGPITIEDIRSFLGITST